MCACILHVHCDFTLINLTDGSIIITKCRCGESKPGVAMTSSQLMGNFILKEVVALL